MTEAIPDEINLLLKRGFCKPRIVLLGQNDCPQVTFLRSESLSSEGL